MPDSVPPANLRWEVRQDERPKGRRDRRQLQKRRHLLPGHWRRWAWYMLRTMATAFVEGLLGFVVSLYTYLLLVSSGVLLSAVVYRAHTSASCRYVGKRRPPARASSPPRCCGGSAGYQRRHTPAKQPSSEACSCRGQRWRKRWRTIWQEVRPMFVYQRVRSSPSSCHMTLTFTSCRLLALEYTSRSAQATPRRSERSVTRRESTGQQVS